MKKAWVLAAALSAWFSNAAAQTVAPPVPGATQAPTTPPAVSPPPAPLATASLPTAPPVTPVPAPQDGGVRLAADTYVRIEIGEIVSSKDRARGDKFLIRLASPIVVDGRTVVPAGATGVGEVVYAERGSGGGAPGKLVLAARYIDVGGVRVRLKAFNLGAGGESEFREMQVAAEFLGPAVFLINGRDVVYPVGTRARAKIADDTVIAAASLSSATSAAPTPAGPPPAGSQPPPNPAVPVPPPLAQPANPTTNPALEPAK